MRNYRIFRPMTRTLSIQKGSEIVKNEHARYTLERFPTDNARVICTKKVLENTSVTSSLNLAVYDFLQELPVLPPSMGNSDTNF